MSELSWEPEALLVIFEGCVETFGGHVGTMLGTLGLSWRLLKAMLVHLEGYVEPFGGHVGAILGLCCAAWGPVRPCRDYVGQLGAVLVIFKGCVEAFGAYVGQLRGHVGTMVVTLKLPWRLLTAMLAHFEAM